MTEPLFLKVSHMRACSGLVQRITEDGGIIPDATVFYAAGGGQPGDTGRLEWRGNSCEIVDTVKGEAGAVILRPAPGAALPQPGDEIVQALDWERRHAHMRMHTALHLLSVVIPLPVSGGAISAEKGRLDFDMPEAPQDRGAIEAALNALVARDLPVGYTEITENELDARPELVKTMSVSPPRGSGTVRLVRIGSQEAQVDLQPCGGTHVASTAEIGSLRLGKIEKKGARNRRVSVHFA
ncbi:alanyl-tRNA editing protein [Profundibacterium mesophilum]|uniref:Alanine--tRNA ligase n=1 Tax=Profundibacterium mesophilum KAUST100406-0324 TaxID=1037889 RepID=A0A921NT87_9RHOB|nr:alanyl-tRNA editing protein [Profundibacterium mesophilum]KAF0677537.1 Alanyl-tRNA synthetase [Profundibacterium mesophilum KAUST100406-0324]